MEKEGESGQDAPREDKQVSCKGPRTKLCTIHPDFRACNNLHYRDSIHKETAFTRAIS